jgi:hypothetical protein
MKIFSKKTWNFFFCCIKKEVVVLHPLRESRYDERKDTHVRRHIELTAALTEMLSKRIRVMKEIKEWTDRSSVVQI